MKCTKIYNTCTQPLFYSLSLLCCDILVSIAIGFNVYLTVGFHVAVHLFSNRSQMMSKLGT